jgi:hypothetical protein
VNVSKNNVVFIFILSIRLPCIIEPSSNNNIATRELGITSALKFENYCKFENCHFTVTAAKENK